MSIWKIKDMEVLKNHNGAENVIWKVNLEVRKSEGKKPFNLPANIDIGDVTGSDFVPFEDVTEDMVIGWLKKTLNKIRPHQEEVLYTKEEECDPVYYTEKDELPKGVSVGDLKSPAIVAGTVKTPFRTSFTEDLEQCLSDEDEIVTVVKTFS